MTASHNPAPGATDSTATRATGRSAADARLATRAGAASGVADEPRWGVGSSTLALRRVFVRPPATQGDFGAAGWVTPDSQSLVRQHAAFVQLLTDLGCDVEIGDVTQGLVDAVYTHDPVTMTPFGAIRLQMRKPVRRDEPAQLTADLDRLGIPVIGELTGDAFSDGGDKVWLDERTLVMGRGYRTTDAAVEQVRAILQPHDVQVISVDLPHYHGRGEVLHLMSLISPLAPDLAAIYEPFVPVRLMELLEERTIATVAIAEDEFDTQGGNILAVAPGVVVIPRGNPATAATLTQAGCEVHEFDGGDVAIKGTGGPTCLTQPLWRADGGLAC